MTVQITEAAGSLAQSSTPGAMRIQIIDAGVGSSGKYPAQTLESAARDRVFHKGLHVHFDHPTAQEAADRPERSVLTLAGSLASDASWNPASQALEADFKPYPSVYDSIRERADDIGLSIRASAEVEDDGTVARIVEAQSVDLVTKAGRGGRILDVIESARREIAERNGLEYKPRHMAKPPVPGRPKFVAPEGLHHLSHWDEQPITEAEEAAEAKWLKAGAQTRPEPDTSPAQAVEEARSTDTAGGNMVDIQESELNQLRKTAGLVEEAQKQAEEAEIRAVKAEKELAEARKEQVRTKAEAIVAEAFAEIDAPRAKSRLIESAVSADEFDPDAFKTEVEESASEFAGATTPGVQHFGDTKPAHVSESADFDYDAERGKIFGGR